MTDRTATLQPRPEPAPAAAWRFPTVERSTLPSGLGLATCHLPGQSVIEVRLTVEGGARSDPAGKEGLTTLTARALTEGTARLDGEAFADALETLGARMGAEVQWDASVVAASAPRSRLVPLLDMLAEAVTSPAFRTEDVERLLRQARDAAAKARQFPQQRVGEAFAAAAYAPGSRRALPPGGSVETLADLDAAMLAPHWAATARPDRATLVLVGDLDDLDVIGLAAGALGSWGATGPALDAPRPVEPSSAGALTIVDLPGAVQTQLLLGLAVERVAIEARPALRLAVHALGGHFNSLLMNELREHRGVTYGVNAMVDHAGGSTALLVGGAFQSDATIDSVVEILRQLREMAAAPDAEALAQAADNLVRTGPTSFRSAAAVAAAVVRNTVERLPDDYDDQQRAAVAATIPAEAGAALDAVLHDGLVVAAVADAASTAGKLAAALGREASVEER